MTATVDTTRASVPSGDAADAAGRIEARGIDVIPDAERHGRARELFTVWAAPNVSYLALVVGGALILMGLQVWQAVAVIVVGNLFSVLVGIIAVSGPASGTPSEVIMRAMFGVRGNRVNIAITGWLVCVCYLALNWAAAAVTGFTLAERFGLPTSTLVKVAIIVAIAAATLAISVYGHATIVRLYVPLTLALTVVFVVLAGYVLGHVQWAYRPRNSAARRRTLGGAGRRCRAGGLGSAVLQQQRRLRALLAPGHQAALGGGLDHAGDVRSECAVHDVGCAGRHGGRHERTAGGSRGGVARLVHPGVPARGDRRDRRQ